MSLQAPKEFRVRQTRVREVWLEADSPEDALAQAWEYEDAAWRDWQPVAV
jgi:hypothetical protein